MPNFKLLLITGLMLPLLANAQNVFENDYFKINIPDGMELFELPADTEEGLKNNKKYRKGNSKFAILQMESMLTASAFVSEYEKAMKKKGQPIQTQRFNVNGFIFPGFVTVDQSTADNEVQVMIMFDNGRHKLKEAGNAMIFGIEMSYPLKDEATQQAINEQALKSLVMKTAKYDFWMTKDFSLTAPALSFVYYGASSPSMMLPSNPLVTLGFGEVTNSKAAGYGPKENLPFDEYLKKQLKDFKGRYSKATLTELTINGYKAALMKGKYENKEYKTCEWKYEYMIEVSPKLVRTISYELMCEYSDIQQPEIEKVINTFQENKK